MIYEAEGGHGRSIENSLSGIVIVESNSHKTSFTLNTAMASAFSLLTAGGAKFDKSRFKDDFQLFEAVRCLLFSPGISTNVAVAEEA